MTIRAKLAGLAAVLTLGCGAGTALGRPAVTIRVVNGDVVEARTLSLAKREASRIFNQAGIDLVWLDCEIGRIDWKNPGPCQRERGPAEFWLRIETRRPKAATDGVLGFTEIDPETGASAGIYYPAAVEMAKRCQVGIGEILGAAIAHEVGHLLLGAKAHSTRGIMQASWSQPQFQLIGLGELDFAPDQATLLREHLETLQRI
jgi:hypothetical protein